MQASPTMLLRSGNPPMSPEQLDAYVNDLLFTERDRQQIDFYDQVLLMNRILHSNKPKSCQQ